MKNVKLHERYRTATKDILSLIARLLAEQKLKVIGIPKTVWVSTDGRIFQPREETQALLSLLVGQAQEQIRELPSVGSLLKTLEEDDLLRPHIDAVIGTSHGGSSFTAIRAIGAIAQAMIFQTKNVEYVDSVFETVYDGVECDLYSNQIVEIRTVPVLGLAVDEELEVNSEISLIALTDDDISGFLTTGASIGMKLGNAVFNPARAAIKIKRSYRKRIGELQIDPEEFRTDDVINGRLEGRVLDTLRIYKPGRIAICGSRTVNDSIFAMGTQFTFGGVQQHVPEALYKLGKDEISGFQDIYGQIMEASRYGQKGFLVAIRRFSTAGERTSAEDRIIDYLIAAEALFLTEEDAQELSYRLAHRAACVLGDSPKSKRELFEKVRTAYRLRSKLVHGKEPGLHQPGKDDAALLAEFADELEGLLRKAITRKLDLARTKHVPVDKLNWDEFLF